MQQLKQIMITLVLLMTASAGAWAQTQGPKHVTLFTSEVIASWEGVNEAITADDLQKIGFVATDETTAKAWTGAPNPGESILFYSIDGNDFHGLNFYDGRSYRSFASNITKGSFYAEAMSSGDYYYTGAPPAGNVTPTTNANEWSMKMPAGNVLLTVAYKDRMQMALKYGEQTITTEANAVTAFMGCEQEFATTLTAALKNIEPTFSSGTAVDVTATLADDFTFESSDANIIGFKNGNDYELTGTLDQMEFRDLTTTPVTLTVTYKGTDELESKSQELKVTIEKKTYTVTLADGTDDAANWKGNVNDAEKDVNLPITTLEGGEKVTLKYNGRRKVKSITATVEPGNSE